MKRLPRAGLGRARLRGLVPPVPLAALLGIVCVVGLAWALLMPPWQAPDETTHYAYVESLAAGPGLPGVKGRPGVSSDQSYADGAVGASRGAFYPESSPPDWSSADFAAYLANERRSPHLPVGNGGGPNPASPNPPLYYAYAGIPYLLDGGGTAFGRLYAIQVWGVLLLLATTLGAWLLAGEVFGQRRLPQLACAAVVGLMPMETFMATSVSPDSLLIALWTLILWLGVRVINRALPARDAVALGALTAAAILTKATGYFVLPAVALALLCGWLRIARAQRRAACRQLGAAGLTIAVPVLAWIGYTRAAGRAALNTVPTGSSHPFSILDFLAYVWQFYLPKLWFMKNEQETTGLGIHDVWLLQGVGTFGWLRVELVPWVYEVANYVIDVIAIAAVVLIARIRDRRRLMIIAFLGLALVGLLGGLHLVDYLSIIAGQGPVLQGRYLLPMLGLFGLAIGQIVARVPATDKPAVVGLTLAGLLALQVLSLTSVINVYYL